MLGDALDYPTAGDAGPAALLLGGLLVAGRTIALVAVAVFYPASEAGFASWPVTGIALGGLLLFELPLRGYRIRALRATARDPTADAPSFRPVRSLFRDGVVGLAVYGIYLLPAVLLGLVVVGGNASGALGDPTDAFARGVAQNVAGLAVLFGLLYLVGVAYVLPAAVTNYAHEGRVRAAFELRRILEGAFSEDYGVSWLISVLFQAVAYPLSLFLWALLVGPFVQFFSAVATRYLWGHGYGRALELEDATPEAPARDFQAPRPKVDTDDGPTDARPPPEAGGRQPPGDSPRTPAAEDVAASSSPQSDKSDTGDDPDDPMASEFGR